MSIPTRWSSSAKEGEIAQPRGCAKQGLRSGAQGNAGEQWHWTTLASEVAHIGSRAEMDFKVVKAIADQEHAGRRLAPVNLQVPGR